MTASPCSAPEPSSAPGVKAWEFSPRTSLLLCALGAVFSLSTFDRAVLPVLKTTLSHELGVTNVEYSRLVSLFLATYTVGYLAVGNVIGHFGVRKALTIAVLVMSCSVALSGTSEGRTQLGLALVLLGLAQACVAPAVTLTIFTHFPAYCQARAYAVVNAIQSSVGVACPPLVAIVSLGLGWRWSFLIPAIIGTLVAFLWWRVAPLAASAAPEASVSPLPGPRLWRELVRSRPVLVLLLARAISDPFWFFFSYWQVAFLRERINMDLASVGRWAWIPPLVGTVAAFAFAIVSDRMIARGVPVIKARILPIVIATALGLSVFLLPSVHSAAWAIALAALTVAMGNTWLSLSAILMGALVPRSTLASALGLMSAVGATSAVVLNSFAGALIDRFGYGAPLWIGATLYPLAAVLLVTHFLWRSNPPTREQNS